MSLAGLVDVLLRDPSLARVVEEVPAGLDLTAPAGARPFVLGALARQRTVLAVTATSREAEELEAALGSALDPHRVALYPS